ncbi:MAG: toxin-antitoxin system YwqK family antitoxin [Candidatus Moranbacteria bacterium]|nr:toxin-antitoxin system YwqK family antitoxin [Candidatus Moranbacteria bacterium]
MKTKMWVVVFIALTCLLSGCSKQKRIPFKELMLKNEMYYYSAELFNGIAFTLYDDGTLESELTVTDGEIKGPYKLWYENGNLAIKGNIFEWRGFARLRMPSVEDKVDNVTEFHYWNGKLQAWYENKQLAFDGNIFIDEFMGVQKMWYKNGQLFFEGSFVNGIEDGVHKAWHENGQLAAVTSFVNGEEDGVLKAWHENGQLAVETSYVNGEKDGVHKEWYENGQLAVEMSYVKGREKSWKEWDENGIMTDQWPR